MTTQDNSSTLDLDLDKLQDSVLRLMEESNIMTYSGNIDSSKKQ